MHARFPSVKGATPSVFPLLSTYNSVRQKCSSHHQIPPKLGVKPRNATRFSTRPKRGKEMTVSMNTMHSHVEECTDGRQSCNAEKETITSQEVSETRTLKSVIHTLRSFQRVPGRNPTVWREQNSTLVCGGTQGLQNTHCGCCWGGWAVIPARIEGVDTDFWSVSRGDSNLGFSIGPELRFSWKVTHV